MTTNRLASVGKPLATTGYVSALGKAVEAHVRHDLAPGDTDHFPDGRPSALWLAGTHMRSSGCMIWGFKANIRAAREFAAVLVALAVAGFAVE